MSQDHDPLLRATADGDPACPDGRALASLGKLMRDAMRPPRKPDLARGVLSRLDGRPAAAPLSGEAIDAFYDGAGDHRDAPPALAAIAGLVRGASELPHDVDLAARVERRLTESVRLAPSRIDLRGRWRIWSAVVAGHVAALLAFAVYQSNFLDGAPAEEDAAAVASQGDPRVRPEERPAQLQRPAPEAPAPASWEQIPAGGFDLFAHRRSANERDAARAAAGLSGTADLVQGALAWLQTRQDPATGRFGVADGDHERDIAVQAIATLALLGEGVEDTERAAAARSALDWLASARAATPAGGLHDEAASGLAALALVEGALLLGDPALRAAAEAELVRAATVVPNQPGPAGLGGFFLLAFETARIGGLTVDARAHSTAWRTLGRALPEDGADAGRIGLAAFARFISGRAGNASTPQLIRQLTESHRLPRPDIAERVDPLGWFFPALALRQEGGDAWTRWARRLEGVLTERFVRADGLAHLPADAVRFAGATPNGDVFATAMAVIDLQVAYRYIRVAR